LHNEQFHRPIFDVLFFVLRSLFSSVEGGDMQKVAVVTGAGSGVGQSTALLLLEGGWGVALVGRREAALRETVEQAAAAGERALVVRWSTRPAPIRPLAAWPS
jgi:NAD(P)-dependent dehydrogenase (short-subunit alcohol dehydrogenase family)